MSSQDYKWITRHINWVIVEACLFGPNFGLLMLQSKTVSSIGSTIFSESGKEIEMSLLSKPTGMYVNCKPVFCIIKRNSSPALELS